jgi:hypothetical protein
MPFKHNATRRHHIPKARHRITNWPAYEAGLRRRGDVTFWLDEAALSEWHAPRRTSRGGQPIYADMAIEVVLTLRLAFHLALRQAEGFTRSVLRLLGLQIAVPDHSTLSRRGRGFAGRQPRAARHDRPVHVVLDSTGLQVFGQGEWDAEKHGRKPRRWRKLHLAVDAETGEIVAHILTDKDGGDITQVPALLATVEGRIASVIADGAYDGEAVYREAAVRQQDPPVDVVIPPRSSSVVTAEAESQTIRDRHVQFIADKGRMAWQRTTCYGRRSLVETAIGRYKHIIASALRARSDDGQGGEVAIAVHALNRMIRIAKPMSVRRN